MRDYEEYVIIMRNDLEGIQKIYRFPNNYGASVIKNYMSYGFEQDKWELAVVKFYGEDNEDIDIAYDTPITNDVIGWLEWGEVEGLLEEIYNLKEL